MATAARHAVILGFALGLGACLGGAADDRIESASPHADGGSEQADAASGSRDAGSPADASAADASPGVLASCATIGAVIPGVSTCRDEPERCSVSVPSTSSCDATCASLGKQCLRLQ